MKVFKQVGKISLIGFMLFGLAVGSVVNFDNGNVASAKAVKVKKVKIAGKKANLTHHASFKVTAKVNNKKDNKVKWSSSNKQVASINKSGKITALKVGKTVIKATSKINKKKFDKFTLKVVPLKVKNLALVQKQSTLTAGSNAQFKYSLSPSNATNKGVTWSSSNSQVATVTNGGYIKAKRAGTTTITVKSNDGAKVVRQALTVKAQPVGSLANPVRYGSTIKVKDSYGYEQSLGLITSIKLLDEYIGVGVAVYQKTGMNFYYSDDAVLVTKAGTPIATGYSASYWDDSVFPVREELAAGDYVMGIITFNSTHITNNAISNYLVKYTVMDASPVYFELKAGSSSLDVSDLMKNLKTKDLSLLGKHLK